MTFTTEKEKDYIKKQVQEIFSNSPLMKRLRNAEYVCSLIVQDYARIATGDFFNEDRTINKKYIVEKTIAFEDKLSKAILKWQNSR